MTRKRAVTETTTTEERTDTSKERPMRNNVKKIREALLLSKAELARKSGLSALTIDRVESGYDCRMETKRKIILALGIELADKDEVFLAGEENDES